MTVEVGFLPSPGMLGDDVGRRRAMVEEIVDAGVHFQVGDHVSFHGGHGDDALINATSLLSMHPSARVFVAIYLLPLRHPMVVARQLASIAQIAPGRLTLGVGIGGEDRHEVEVCGVDPRTRGRRMDESLEILRNLATGRPVSFHGRFFELDDAVILPAPSPRIPLIVGGRSDAAVRRAALLGDGWVGIWVSSQRFASAVARIDEEAEAAQRERPEWHHALNVWCGFGPSAERARHDLAEQMQAYYDLPFETFERWCPYGAPEQVAAFLAPYVDAGCRSFNLTPCGDRDGLLEAIVEVRRLLTS